MQCKDRSTLRYKQEISQFICRISIYLTVRKDASKLLHFVRVWAIMLSFQILIPIKMLLEQFLKETESFSLQSSSLHSIGAVCILELSYRHSVFSQKKNNMLERNHLLNCCKIMFNMKYTESHFSLASKTMYHVFNPI